MSRLPNPRCPRCDSAEHVTVALRTECAVYFRCAACGKLVVQSMPVVQADDVRPRSRTGPEPSIKDQENCSQADEGSEEGLLGH